MQRESCEHYMTVMFRLVLSFTFFILHFILLKLLLKILITFIKYFPDFDLDDADTCRATVRMFLQCNLVQQFHIPYDVSANILYLSRL